MNTSAPAGVDRTSRRPSAAGGGLAASGFVLAASGFGLPASGFGVAASVAGGVAAAAGGGEDATAVSVNSCPTGGAGVSTAAGAAVGAGGRRVPTPKPAMNPIVRPTASAS